MLTRRARGQIDRSLLGGSSHRALVGEPHLHFVVGLPSHVASRARRDPEVRGRALASAVISVPVSLRVASVVARVEAGGCVDLASAI